jgi:prophage antirepressor-like protein
MQSLREVYRMKLLTIVVLGLGTSFGFSQDKWFVAESGDYALVTRSLLSAAWEYRWTKLDDLSATDNSPAY